MTIKVISTPNVVEKPAAPVAHEPAIEKVEKSEAAPAEAQELAETAAESEPVEPKDEDEAESKDAIGEEEEGDEEAEEAPKAPKKNGFKKRIDKLSKRAADAEREAAFWREQAQKGQPQKPEAQTAARTEASPSEPKADNFDTHEQYIRALTRWEIAEESKAREAKEAQAKAQEAFTSKLKSYQGKVKALRTEFPDAPEVFASVDDVVVPKHIADIFLDSENGHELSYHLAKDPEEFERICSLPERQAVREIGRFEASLKSEEKPKAKQTSTKAPEPIKPLSSRSSQSAKKSIYDAAKMDQAEFEALRRSQMAQRRA